MRRRVSWLVPWLLLAPGLLWLFFFYVLPSIQMFTYSISTGSIEEGFTAMAQALKREAERRYSS